MLKRKDLFDYTNLFFPNEYEKNDEIVKKIYFIKSNSYRKFKNLQISYIFDKMLVRFIIYGKYGCNDENIFKEKIEISKIIGYLITWRSTRKNWKRI